MSRFNDYISVDVCFITSIENKRLQHQKPHERKQKIHHAVTVVFTVVLAAIIFIADSVMIITYGIINSQFLSSSERILFGYIYESILRVTSWVTASQISQSVIYSLP